MSLPPGEPRSFRAIERVGIIGAGAAAELHLRALRRVGGLRVVAVRDLDASRAAALAARFGLAKDASEPGAFYEKRPQSVHIATPPDAHEELTLEALQHGAHVLVEKPPALTIVGCENLLRESADRKLEVGVNENTALEPLVRKARALIEAGRVGRLLHIDGFYSLGLPEPDAVPDWMGRLPGGVLEDVLPHLITTARALAGVQPIPEHWHLSANGGRPARHDELRLLLKAGEALTIGLTVSASARPKAFWLVVRGTRATLTVDLRNMLLHASRPEPRGGAIGAGAQVARSALSALNQTAANAIGIIGGYREPHGSFFHLVRAHYAALRAGTEIPAPLARAKETIALVRRIWPIGNQPDTG